MKRKIFSLIFVVLILCIAGSLYVANKYSNEYKIYKKDNLVAVVSSYPLAPNKDKIYQRVMADLNDYYGENNYVVNVDLQTNDFNTIKKYVVTYSTDITPSNEWNENTRLVNVYRYCYGGSGNLIDVSYGTANASKSIVDDTVTFGTITNVTSICNFERK